MAIRVGGGSRRGTTVFVFEVTTLATLVPTVVAVVAGGIEGDCCVSSYCSSNIRSRHRPCYCRRHRRGRGRARGRGHVMVVVVVVDVLVVVVVVVVVAAAGVQ